MPLTNLECSSNRTTYPEMEKDVNAVKSITERFPLKLEKTIVGSSYVRFRLARGFDFKPRMKKELEYYIETGLASKIRISEEGSNLLIDKQLPSEPILFGNLITSNMKDLKGIKLFLGKDKNNVPVIADLDNARSVLIAGTTGAGKSTLINTMLAGIMIRADIEPVDITIIDLKGIDYLAYKSNKRIHFVNKERDATNLLFSISNEINKRIDVLGKTNSFRPLVVFVDDISYLEKNNLVQESLNNIVTRGYCVCVYPILSVQGIVKEWISEDLLMKIYTKICFYMAIERDYKKILGQYGSERLGERYSMLYLGRGKTEPIWIQGAEVADNDKIRINSFFEKIV